MATPPRLVPLLAQYDFARERLANRMAGPEVGSGNGVNIKAFETGAAAWRAALTSADDAALDQVGCSDYPDGSDPDEPFIEIVWWVNQELLHHGAEISLLRDLYRERRS
jgi:hypothetical protein